MADLEKTVEFILEQQAQTSAQLLGLTVDVRKLTADVERLTAGSLKAEARQAKTDRRVDALAKLVRTGMKMLVKIEKDMAERDKATNFKINALVDAQQRTDRKLDRLITILVRAQRNGR